MKQKKWCVHVHTHPAEYEDIIASSAVSAKQEILAQFYNTHYEEVCYVEVRRQCDCGYDNDADAEWCYECGAGL